MTRHTEPKAIGLFYPLSIVVPLLAGAALAAAQHFYFSWLHSQNPLAYADGDRSIQAFLAMPRLESILSNGLALTVKALYSFSITSGMAQIVWRKARAGQFSIAQYDHLFALPSISAISSLMLSRFLLPFFPLLLVACGIWSLSLITIVVPSSIVVTDGQPMTASIDVPTVNLSAAPTDNTAIYQYFLGGFTSALPVNLDFARALSLASPPTFPAPSACKRGCNYTFTYDAPALQCTDLGSANISDETGVDQNTFAAQLENWRTDPSTVSADIKSTNFEFAFEYNATWIFELGAAHNFSVVLKPKGADAFGAACLFYLATHTASTSFKANVQQTNVSIVEFKGLLAEPSPAAYAMSIGFFSILNGVAGLFFDQGQVLPSVDTSAMDTPLFALNATDASISVTDQLGDGLSTGLQTLMTHATLATLFRTEATQRVEAQVLSANSFWNYDSAHLLLVYGLLTFMTALCAVYGLSALYGNHAPGTFAFSHLLAATRSEALNELALDDDMHVLPPETMDVVLRYGKVEIEQSRWIHSFGVVDKEKVIPFPVEQIGLHRRKQTALGEEPFKYNKNDSV